jgi:hypothetical protein
LSPKEASVPWLGVSGPSQRETRDARATRHGRNWKVPVGAADGDYSIGPYSREKGELEFRRLAEVITSIRRNGYRPDSARAHIQGYVLERHDDWRICVMSGTHRVPALMALGHDTIPMVLRYPARRVRIEDAGVWPGVLSGDFSKDEAEALYERVFEGRDPDWLAEAIGSSEYGAIMEAFGRTHWSGPLSWVGQ